MTTSIAASAPISGLLSVVAEALDPTPTATPVAGATASAAPVAAVPYLELPTVLGPLAGAWMAVKEDGEGWMLLQFTARSGSTPAPGPAPAQSAEARPLPVRPDFAARARRVHTALTNREREVLCLVAGGATNCAIAARLFISPKTASVHVSRILAKLNATTRTEAAALAHASGLVRPYDAVVA